MMLMYGPSVLVLVRADASQTSQLHPGGRHYPGQQQQQS